MNLRDFGKYYNIFLICLLIYPLVFVLNLFLAPWHSEKGLSFADLEWSFSYLDNANIFNFKFLFYGIYDLLEVLIYKPPYMPEEHSEFFFDIFTSLYSLANIIEFTILYSFNKHNNNNKLITALTTYMLDNILAYFTCLITYFISPPLYKLFITNVTDKTGILIIGAIYLILIGISSPIILKVVLYIASMIGVSELVLSLKENSDNPIVTSILTCSIIIISVIIINLILDALIEKFYHIFVKK